MYNIVTLIREANKNGAIAIKSCDVAGISKRTFERWCKNGACIKEDKRKTCIKAVPKIN